MFKWQGTSGVLQILVFFPWHSPKGRYLVVEEPGRAGSQPWTWRPEPGSLCPRGLLASALNSKDQPARRHKPMSREAWGDCADSSQPPWLLDWQNILRVDQGEAWSARPAPSPTSPCPLTVSSAGHHSSVSFIFFISYDEGFELHLNYKGHFYLFVL